MKQLFFASIAMLSLFSCQSSQPTDNKTAETTTTTATPSTTTTTPAATTETGYKVGDIAADFNLKNVDGNMLSLASMKDAKGFIVVFTCNHCPYSIAYEDRLIDLQKTFGAQGYPVVAINPNDPKVVADDSFEEMQKRAKDKKFNFPYLFDDGQKVYPTFGATRTPHVYVLQKDAESKLVVKYIGAIDDNHEDPKAVKTTYLANAMQALIKGETPNPDFTKAIGCSIKKS
jgi:peroxiredoxin